jgi:hypothetical protein
VRKLTRTAFIGGTAAAAFAAAGSYELVDRLTKTPERRRPAGPLPPEQHLLEDVGLTVDNRVVVVVPPLHHKVVTATMRVEETPAALAAASKSLEDALRGLEATYSPTPAGLGITVAWGLPYFQRFVPGQARAHLPVDRRASGTRGRRILVLEDAERFPSDPPETLLEQNHVAVLLRSDSLDHIAAGAKALFTDLDLFHVTSIRRGFAGGGFGGGQSLPKQMAVAAGVPGADLIPDSSELFLGFTSTQRHALGPGRIANIETLGYADLGPSGYFVRGTHMHLSHVNEDLEAWYLNFDHSERVSTAFRPGLSVAEGTLTVPQPPSKAADVALNASDYEKERQIGHSASLQPASRLQQRTVGADGTIYRKGTAVPQRADFNTLDNPFFWTATPERDGYDPSAAAGVHFLSFNPTGDDFRRGRLAMDGVQPDGTILKFPPRARGQGFNSILRTTHRQNYLVPPRAHRALPLAELRS